MSACCLQVGSGGAVAYPCRRDYTHAACRYNAFQGARLAGAQRFNIVFLDGHAATPVDDVWRHMADEVYYLKHLKPRTCFDTAVFTPLGYVHLLSGVQERGCTSPLSRPSLSTVDAWPVGC